MHVPLDYGNFTGVPQGTPPVNPVIPGTRKFDRHTVINTYKKLHTGNETLFEVPQLMEPVVNQKQMGNDEEGVDDKTGPKRKRDDKVQKQKHSNREKKRRMEMNEAIDRLKGSVPKSDKSNSSKPDRVGTKVNILNDAADYIEKLENILKNLEKEKQQLMEENHQMAMQMSRYKGWDDCKPGLNEAPFSLVTLPGQNQTPPMIPSNLPQHVLVPGQGLQTYQLPPQQFQQFQAIQAHQLLALQSMQGWPIQIQPQQLARAPNQAVNRNQNPILNPALPVLAGTNPSMLTTNPQQISATGAPILPQIPTIINTALNIPTKLIPQNESPVMLQPLCTTPSALHLSTTIPQKPSTEDIPEMNVPTNQEIQPTQPENTQEPNEQPRENNVDAQEPTNNNVT
jgi:hypothetical protein